MPVVVVTPIEQEWDSLTNTFEKLDGAGCEQRTGRLKGQSYLGGRLLLVQGGLGKVQFAVHTQHVLDQLGDVEAVICAGVSGAISDGLSVGDVVAATSTVEHDFNWKAKLSSLPTLPTFPGHAPYLSILADLELPGQSFKVHLGPVASGDEAILDASRARELHEVTGALAVAWEGAGGARAATFSGVPYLEVRGISDNADNEAADVWVQNLPSAMENVGLVIHELLQRAPLK